MTDGAGSPVVPAPGDLESRVRVLEAAVGQPSAAPAPAPAPRPEPKSRDAWDKVHILMPLIQGVIIALVGYWLTGAVNEAFKRQELQLANAREMRELLKTLQASDTTPEEAQTSAFTLAAFGTPAVAPLVSALAAGGEARAPAAEAALRAIGLSTPAAVCGPMARIVANRSGRFSWLAHQAAIRLLGDLQCLEARAVLARYETLLGDIRAPADVDRYREAVAAWPPVDLASVEEVRAELERTRRLLGDRR